MNLSASSAKYHVLISLGERGGSSQFGRLPHLHQRPFQSSANHHCPCGNFAMLRAHTQFALDSWLLIESVLLTRELAEAVRETRNKNLKKTGSYQ
jgi:hypothetical protein